MTEPFAYYHPPGSAVAAGEVEEDPLVGPIKAVWVMVADRTDHNFWRYDVDGTSWEDEMDATPAEPGDGGALAFVPNPTTQASDGWVFALQGGNTRGFWCYHPDLDVWFNLTGVRQVPEEVTDGGALCFGGFIEIANTQHAIVYALTGQWTYQQQGQYYRGHVWRYVFPCHSTQVSPQGGVWEQMPSFLYRVDAGGALAWASAANGGTLVATLGSYSDYIWRLDPNAVTPQWAASQYPLDPHPNDGLCMTVHEDGNRVKILHGSGTGTSLSEYDVDADELTLLADPPQSLDYGAGIAQVADICYAQFGGGDGSRMPGFAWYEDEGGGQSAGTVGRAGVQVRTQASRGSHRFDVTGATGTVQLAVMDIAGRAVESMRAEPQSGRVALTWNHRGAQGIFFYRISSGDFYTSGKAVTFR